VYVSFVQNMPTSAKNIYLNSTSV